MAMKARVVVLDVYGTLLDVGPAPADVDSRWQTLCRVAFGRPDPRSWPVYGEALREAVRTSRTIAQERGVPVPEVDWSGIVGEVLPGWRDLPVEARERFLVEQAGLTHTVRLHPGAGRCLNRLRADGVLLAIASNAQPYTLVELERELGAAGLTLGAFKSDLCFWSWRHGFAKPDPHVFRVLDIRLRLLGFRPGEILMIGDRMDNDVLPAKAWGWQAWHLAAAPRDTLGGDWSTFEGWWWGASEISARIRGEDASVQG